MRSITGWNMESDRYRVWSENDGVRSAFWQWLLGGDSLGQDYCKILGLEIAPSAPTTVYRQGGRPTVEIHAVRPALRRTAEGSARTDVVIEITQQRWGYFDPKVQAKMDGVKPGSRTRLKKPDFIFRAGCTALVDSRTSEVRRVMQTPGTVADPDELNRVRRYLTGEGDIVGNAFDANLPESLSLGERRLRDEPFAFLHQLEEG